MPLSTLYIRGVFFLLGGKLLPLQGDRLASINNPGWCPGLGASALSGRIGEFHPYNSERIRKESGKDSGKDSQKTIIKMIIPTLQEKGGSGFSLYNIYELIIVC